MTISPKTHLPEFVEKEQFIVAFIMVDEDELRIDSSAVENPRLLEEGLVVAETSQPPHLEPADIVQHR